MEYCYLWIISYRIFHYFKTIYTIYNNKSTCTNLINFERTMDKTIYNYHIFLQVVKMFIIVVVIFAICWLPYQGFFIFVYHHRHLAENSNIQHVYLSFYWLAMSNAMVNPIIYYWMNNRWVSYLDNILFLKKVHS